MTATRISHETDDGAPRYASLWRLLGELLRSPGQVAAIVALILIVAIAYAALPWLISRAIDDNVLPRDRSGLTVTGLLLAAAILVRAVAESIEMDQVGRIAQDVLARLRSRLFATFQSMPIAELDRRPTGELMSRATNDVDTLDDLLTQIGPHLVAAMFNFFAVLLAMLLMDWKLALVTFLIIPPMAIVVIASGDRAHPRFRRTRETAAEISSELQETITSIRDIQSLNRADESERRFREINERNRDASIRATRSLMLVSPTIDVLSAIGTAIVIGVGGYLALAGHTSVGTVAGFIVYVHLFYRPIYTMASLYERLPAALAGANLIYEVLDQTETVRQLHSIDPPKIAGAIELADVQFAYTPGRRALNGVSLRIEPGEHVAIVGETGAGKSTIINLILGFYDATTGRVLIDSQNVQDLPMADVRQQMAVVLQEGHIFSGTIAENIGWGRPGSSRDEVEQAARTVGAHEIFLDLPDGYDTVVGQLGRRLSQGQRQLVSLARAVLVEPRILILDEATSNVDLRIESAVHTGTRALMSGRTSIVIAHRFSSLVTDVDRIYLLDAGRIVEVGRHSELLALDGIYANLYARQHGEVTAQAGE